MSEKILQWDEKPQTNKTKTKCNRVSGCSVICLTETVVGYTFRSFGVALITTKPIAVDQIPALFVRRSLTV